METRNPFDASEVVGRRGGAVKQPLSRDAIVTEALAQLTRDGLDAMSLRKVAAALETGPASLYVYVSDLDELQTLVFDRALARVAVRGAKQKDWRARVKGLLESYHHVLVSSPGLAQLAFRRAAVGPNALRIVDAILGDLASCRGRSSNGRVGRSTFFFSTSTAQAAEQGQRPTDPENDRSNPEGAAARAIRGVSAETYPHIHALRDELVSGPGQRMSWGIDSILNGVVPLSKLARKVPTRDARATRSKTSRRR